MKTYKHIISALIMATVVAGCNVNDNFEGVEDFGKPTNKFSYHYTLTDDDYVKIGTEMGGDNGAFVKKYKYFTSAILASDNIPLRLKTLYPYGDEGSTVFAKHNYRENIPSYVSDLSSCYKLDNADYQTAWGSTTNFVAAFTPAVSAQTHMAAILTAKFPEAQVNSYKAVNYMVSDEEAYIGGSTTEYHSENWETYTASTPIGTEGGWINKDVTGTKKWQCRFYNNNKYAQFSSNNSTELNEVWLIKQFALDNSNTQILSFMVNVGYWNANCLTVQISTDFTGNENDIATATWTDLTSNFTIPTNPTSGYGVLTNAGNADISAYKGQNVYVGFKYTGDGTVGSTTPKTTTIQIDDVKILKGNIGLLVDNAKKKYGVYKKTATTWEPASPRFVILQPADYTSMGFAYDNFSTATPAANYLPTFFANLYPYAQEADTLVAVYNHYASGQTLLMAQKYIHLSGVWAAYNPVVEKVCQFKFQSGQWVFIDSDILIGLNEQTGLSSNLGAFTPISVKGDQVWTWAGAYGAKMSGYSGGNIENEDWLVSPAMDLTKRAGATIHLTFDHTGKYFTNMKNEIGVWVSEKSEGTAIVESEWKQLTLTDDSYPTGTDWTFVPTKPIDLSAYAGKANVRIAFKYTSTATGAATWEVKNAYVFQAQ